ncbi:MAG: [FeFe] hydrogenase H-cluster radical SAM maturase HydE [Eubacteriales bacterium]
MNYNLLIDNILSNSRASKDEILELFQDSAKDDLFFRANKVKEENFGKDIILRGIVEFSNYCRCSCSYCGLYEGNKELERFRFSVDEIVSYAQEAFQAGYKSIILQSGEDLHFNADLMSEAIKRIKALGDLSLTLSIGERPREEYKQWFKDGADRYLLKHETADESLYNKLHPHSNFQKRLGYLNSLKEIGYETGSGFMVGLPGQTTESLADDILLLKELELDMAGIGIFISHPGTPLVGSESGSPLDALKCVAITRLLLNMCHLPSTTSVEVGSSEKYTPLNCGANVIMKKVEPYKYRKLYEIYPNNKIADKTIKDERDELVDYIHSVGLTVSSKKGLTSC